MEGSLCDGQPGTVPFCYGLDCRNWSDQNFAIERGPWKWPRRSKHRGFENAQGASVVGGIKTAPKSRGCQPSPAKLAAGTVLTQQHQRWLAETCATGKRSNRHVTDDQLPRLATRLSSSQAAVPFRQVGGRPLLLTSSRIAQQDFIAFRRKLTYLGRSKVPFDSLTRSRASSRGIEISRSA